MKLDLRLRWVQVWAPFQGRGTGATQGGQTAARRQSRLPAVTASPGQRVGNKSHIVGPLLDPAHILDSSRRRVWAVTRAHLSGEPPASSELSARLSPLATSEKRPLKSRKFRRPAGSTRSLGKGLPGRPLPHPARATKLCCTSGPHTISDAPRHASPAPREALHGSPGLGVGTRARSCLAYLFTL